MNNPDVHLQFQDFEDDGGEMKSDGAAVRMDDPLFGQIQRRSAGASSVEEDDDQTELLRGEKKSSAFWTLEYYQTFFDVDTQQVVSRIIGSALPWRAKHFVRLCVRNNPDLYGPFWICATLVFAITVSGNISGFLKHYGEPKYKYVPEFSKVTVAATAIYSYASLVPLALWAFLSWRRRGVSEGVSFSFLQIVCVYGYSLSVYVPAAVLCVVPSEVLRWSLIVLALCLSGSVLVLTFWPVIRDDRPRVAAVVLSALLALHVLLTVGCKVYFFSTHKAVSLEHADAPVTTPKSLTTIKSH
ncbi:protein YIPF1 isoform X2 [Trichomycterus rosablanca]|uniref:protein YIPF1 isoform X2 n=1 Tax=Trichomycterus rosablanca TaxID=2290929 RepID=UPI002F351A90